MSPNATDAIPGPLLCATHCRQARRPTAGFEGACKEPGKEANALLFPGANRRQTSAACTGGSQEGDSGELGGEA